MRTALALCLIVLLVAVSAQAQVTSPAATDAASINRALGRGINLGNALDAPTEGEWGVTLEESYFQAIKDAGFDSVRIPVRFSAHAQADAPYTIDPAFMDRAAWAVDQSLRRNLAVIINVHHYNEIYQDPDAHLPRLLGLWEQIAERFKDAPPTLVMEIMNQPTGAFDAKRWNNALRQALAIIRKSNPERIVMIGPAMGNRPAGLASLDLPADDRRIIVTVHYYAPQQFTNQGAAWVQGADQWLGMKWGSPAEQQAMAADFDIVSKWAQQNDRPIHLGEFGVYEAADMDSRVRWTRFAVEQCLKRGWSFAYWEFCSGFGAYDPQARQWRAPLRAALLDPLP
jgi:endoglucanase